MQQRAGSLDLNDLPFDLNEDVGVTPPNYFTQLMDEAIDESPLQPMNTKAPNVNIHPGQGDTDTRPFFAGTNTTTVAEDEYDEEASSQPTEPHVGMRYDTLQLAKEHYNSYAAWKEFSINLNTNRRLTYTGVLEKQKFACNKFREPKNRDNDAEPHFDVGPILDHVSPTEEEIEDAKIELVLAEIGSKGGKKKKPKMKRENIIHTGCKAKMVVKLIDGRWEVITFMPKHNHPLRQKPSLVKYLKSHQGVPKEEKDFVKNLHSTNLTAGIKLGF
jgi:hypothetical protein